MRYDLLLPFSDFEPTDFADCKLWLRADAGYVTKDGSDLVSQWNDLSGLGNHVTAAGSLRPKWIGGVVNGLPVIRFSVAAEYLLYEGTGVGVDGADTPFTCFAVARSVDPSATERTAMIAFANTTSDTPQSKFSFENAASSPTKIRSFRRDDASGDGTPALATGINTAIAIRSQVFNGTSSTIYSEGATDSDTAAQNVGACTYNRICIGGTVRGAVPALTEQLVGDLAEIIIYGGRALSAAEHNLVGNYLAAQYGGLTWAAVT